MITSVPNLFGILCKIAQSHKVYHSGTMYAELVSIVALVASMLLRCLLSCEALWLAHVHRPVACAGGSIPLACVPCWDVEAGKVLRHLPRRVEG